MIAINGAKFLRLPFAEKRAFSQAALLLPTVTVFIRLLGYQRTRKIVGFAFPLGGGDENLETVVDEARAMSRTVTIASRHSLSSPQCLPRTLTLWALLRRRGIKSEVRLGVRKTGPEMEAHAWLEHAGRPLNDDDGVLDRFPPLLPLASR